MIIKTRISGKWCGKKLANSSYPYFQTEDWAALYRLRGSVERAFSRLKGRRSLNEITVRRKGKVTLHCYLSLIAMQVLI